MRVDRLSTPAHIVPEWYFLPYYSVLRSVALKAVGVLLLAIGATNSLISPLAVAGHVIGGLYSSLSACTELAICLGYAGGLGATGGLPPSFP